MIEIQHLTKTFTTAGGTTEALKDVSLTIPDGEIYGIIGMSGAGKSTLVRSINMLERPTSGKIVIDGRDMAALSEAELRAARRDITMIFQGFGHAQLGGLAALLANIVKEKTGAKVRGIELSLLQRCAAHCASQTDIDESYMSGKTAVEEMLNGVTDKMVGFECDRTNGYVCRAKLFNLSDVANFEKKFPKEWITAEGNNVTEDFAKYALPLIQGETKLEKEDGLPRFARLKKVFAK